MRQYLEDQVMTAYLDVVGRKGAEERSQVAPLAQGSQVDRFDPARIRTGRDPGRVRLGLRRSPALRRELD
jgi:hypothetical protein